MLARNPGGMEFEALAKKSGFFRLWSHMLCLQQLGNGVSKRQHCHKLNSAISSFLPYNCSCSWWLKSHILCS
jgi:hypothetical protein